MRARVTHGIETQRVLLTLHVESQTSRRIVREIGRPGRDAQWGDPESTKTGSPKWYPRMNLESTLFLAGIKTALQLERIIHLK